MFMQNATVASMQRWIFDIVIWTVPDLISGKKGIQLFLYVDY